MNKGFWIAPNISALVGVLYLIAISSNIGSLTFADLAIAYLLYAIAAYISVLIFVIPLQYIFKLINFVGFSAFAIIGVVSSLVLALLLAYIPDREQLPFIVKYINLLKVVIPLGLVCSISYWYFGVRSKTALTRPGCGPPYSRP